MTTQAQQWQACVPKHVCLLGLVLYGLVCSCLYILLRQFQAPLGCVALLILIYALLVYRLWTQPKWCMILMTDLSFGIQQDNQVYPIVIKHCWLSPWFIAVQFHHVDVKYKAVFWRWALSSDDWRQLHIYVTRHQLQYQYASQKGTR